MASVTDVEKLADDLESLVQELRDEVKNGSDFERLMQIADEISEHADNAAQTFSSVNETLMERLANIAGAKKSSRGNQSKSRSGASAS
jgi:ABC-type transporter Mla subunit MlaD